MNPTCLALDFDGTLAYFDGGKEDLFRLFTDQGVPLALVRASYDAVRESGFSIGKMIDDVIDRTDVVVDADALYRKNLERVTSQLHLYPDAERFKKPFSLPVAIVTFGDESNQRFNIERVGLVYEHLLATNAPDSKYAALQSLLSQYGAPVVFVDDKATELDAVRDAGLTQEQVATYRIARPGAEHGFQQARHPHHEISSIDDLLAHIKIGA